MRPWRCIPKGVLLFCRELHGNTLPHPVVIYGHDEAVPARPYSSLVQRDSSTLKVHSVLFLLPISSPVQVYNRLPIPLLLFSRSCTRQEAHDVNLPDLPHRHVSAKRCARALPWLLLRVSFQKLAPLYVLKGRPTQDATVCHPVLRDNAVHN